MTPSPMEKSHPISWTVDGISSTLPRSVPSWPSSPPSPSSTVIDWIGTPVHFLCFHSDSRSYLICDRHTSTLHLCHCPVRHKTAALQPATPDPQAPASREKQATLVRITPEIQDGPVRCVQKHEWFRHYVSIFKTQTSPRLNCRNDDWIPPGCLGGGMREQYGCVRRSSFCIPIRPASTGPPAQLACVRTCLSHMFYYPNSSSGLHEPLPSQEPTQSGISAEAALISLLEGGPSKEDTANWRHVTPAVPVRLSTYFLGWGARWWFVSSGFVP